MESNFLFLSKYWPSLCEICMSAERHLYDSPATSVIELGRFAEAVTGEILSSERLVPDEDNQFNCIVLLERKGVLPSTIVEALHQIRMARNAVSHGRGNVTAGAACGLLRSAYILAVWFMKYYDRTFSADRFSLPKPGETISDEPYTKVSAPPRLEPPVHTASFRPQISPSAQKPARQTDGRVPVLAILLLISILFNLYQYFLLCSR